MNRDDAVNLFAVHQADWNARDPEALASRHTPDGIVVSPIFRTVEGFDEILDSYRSLFTIFPDWQYIGQEPMVDGNRLAQPFLVHATHSAEFMGLPGSGRKVEIEGVRVFEMKDGLIAYERRYYDFTGFLIQLGVLRSKPAR
jgi:steroid delta-isomerase-like uncharacterized protein